MALGFVLDLVRKVSYSDVRFPNLYPTLPEQGHYVVANFLPIDNDPRLLCAASPSDTQHSGLTPHDIWPSCWFQTSISQLRENRCRDS